MTTTALAGVVLYEELEDDPSLRSATLALVGALTGALVLAPPRPLPGRIRLERLPSVALACLTTLGFVLIALNESAEDSVVWRTTILTALAAGTAAVVIWRLRRVPLRIVLRRALTRRYVDGALDRLRFAIDTFPRSTAWLEPLRLPELHPAVYQALPWVGIDTGRRMGASHTRWQAMRPLVEQRGVRTALDVGANVGWFTFSLAELGISTVGLDRGLRQSRIALYVRRRARLADRTSYLVMDLSAENAELLPSADAVLFLSVWHHIVREHGLETGTRILEALWERTRRVLFFETGEAEMPASWGLPAMAPDARSWIAAYLAETCAGGGVVHLGAHDAVDPDNGPCRRNLFALVRDGS
jgi:hypothetical protein